MTSIPLPTNANNPASNASDVLALPRFKVPTGTVGTTASLLIGMPWLFARGTGWHGTGTVANTMGVAVLGIVLLVVLNVLLETLSMHMVRDLWATIEAAIPHRRRDQWVRYDARMGQALAWGGVVFVQTLAWTTLRPETVGYAWPVGLTALAMRPVMVAGWAAPIGGLFVYGAVGLWSVVRRHRHRHHHLGCHHSASGKESFVENGAEKNEA